MRLRIQQQRRNGCTGVTLLEVMTAMALLGMVFMAVAYLQVATAKQVRSLYGDARTLHRAHLVLERIRYKLCMALVGTPQVSEDGRTIEYIDPNLNGQISMIKWIDGKVFWYKNKTLAASTPGQGIGPVEDIQFETLGPGNAVRVTVTTVQKFSWKLDRPFTLNTEITLRN